MVIKEPIISVTEAVFVMAKLRVKLGLRNASDSEVVTIAINVFNGVKNNERFRDSYVDMPAFETAINEFKHAIAIRPNAGKLGTADKNEKRRKVENFIRKMAAYVDSEHNDNPETLLSTGFSAKNPSHAPGPIPKAIILTVNNGITGELVLIVQAIKNAKSYQAQSATVSRDGVQGPWQDHSPFTNSRSMRVNGLTSGTTYAFQVRGIGTMGPGDWSDPVSHMCS